MTLYAISLKKVIGQNLRSAVLSMITQLGVYYDVTSSEWRNRRTNAVLEDPVSLIQGRIIKFLRANYPEMSNKGVISAELLKDAENCPELTITPEWCHRLRAQFCGDEEGDVGMSRISGKAIVAAWLSDTGQELPDNLGAWIRRHPFLIKRIYDLVSACGLIYAGMQRIGEKVHRTVYLLSSAAQLKLQELRARRRAHTTGDPRSSKDVSDDQKTDICELELPISPVISSISPT